MTLRGVPADEVRHAANELKFLVDPGCARAVGEWAKNHLGPDPNAAEAGDSYETTSLYFDTEDLDVLNQRGSYARSKYRVRRYGDGGRVFLERKLKKDGAVRKRRSIVGVDDLSRLASLGPERGWNGYWFHRRILARQLRPVCQISYRRLARESAGDTDTLRLTIDRELRAHRTGDLRFDHGAKGVALSESHPILELKFRQALPSLFAGLIQEFNLIPATVSKYRLAAAALGVNG